MCGIAGQLSFENHPLLDDDTANRMCFLMERRGPDDIGRWSDGKHCSFLFRRLSILDLSPAGHQPMLTADRRFALVFNGEVYNFRELRSDLEERGVQFRSTGDAEVVLYALVHWGRQALRRFNGMFALAFYDTYEKRLLLARDHAGIKPLYYLANNRCVVFASQYDQLLTHPESRNCSPSLEALSLYLQLGYIPAPHAFLKQTHMLEPGTWFEITAGGDRHSGRWFSFPKKVVANLRGEEAFEAVDTAVTNAVRRQLVSDVPIGTFLSGGIDSPLVAAKMKQALGSSVRAFTIGTNGDELDESKNAVIYAKELGVEHILRQFGPNEAAQMVDSVVSACSEPFADYSMFPTMLVSGLARERVTVMLSGDGGDELFWGYYGRFASVLELAKDFRQPHSLRVARRVATRYLGLGSAKRNIINPSIGDWYRGKHSRLFDWQAKALFPNLPDWPAAFQLFDYHGGEADEIAQWLRWNEFVGHLTMVLLKVDRASMYHSLEVRVPLLDREVVDVALRVDWHSCLDLKNGIGKLPLRHSLAKHVEKQTSVKRGFTVPMGHWLRGPLKSRFEEVVLNRKDFLGLPFNSASAKEMFAKHQRGDGDYGYGLWVLLSLALWEERHFRTWRS